jgi:sulfur-oxidizing protein SoxY
MTQRLKLDVVDRREFVVGAAAAATLAAFLSRIGTASAQDKPPTFDELYNKIVGDKKPEEGKVSIDLPEIAENGNTVPYTVAIDNPMSDSDFVKAIHIFAPGNPGPSIATFYFTPLSGAAKVSSRMRLAKTQDIVAVAELSNGSMLVGKRTVKVTIGGCGG